MNRKINEFDQEIKFLREQLREKELNYEVIRE